MSLPEITFEEKHAIIARANAVLDKAKRERAKVKVKELEEMKKWQNKEH